MNRFSPRALGSNPGGLFSCANGLREGYSVLSDPPGVAGGRRPEDDWHHHPGRPVPHHKRKRAKHQRAGCLMCKPHKDERRGELAAAEGNKPVLLMLQDPVPDAFQVQRERELAREAEVLGRDAAEAREDARRAREEALELERRAVALEARVPALAFQAADEDEGCLAPDLDVDAELLGSPEPLRVPFISAARLRAGKDEGTAMT